MQKKLLVVVLGTLFALTAFADDAPAAGAAPAAAAAPAPAVTSNLSLVSNYLYRGISQSGNNPAVQGGFDYTHASGFYAGTWGSSISWIGDLGIAPGAGLELDTYFGIKNSFATDFSYDVGFLRYNYPGNYNGTAQVGGTNTGTTTWDKADTNEVYALIGYKWFTLKYSDSLGSTFALPNASGTNYIDLSASYSIGDSGYTLGAHYGIQTYKGTTADQLKSATQDPTYSDYRVSVSKDFGNTYAAGLTYSGTNAKTGAGQYYNVQGKDLGAGTVVVNVTRTF